MQPTRIEEVTLRMPRHHLSVQEVRRIAMSYIESRMSLHPKYEIKNSFTIAVFSDTDNGLEVGAAIVASLPIYVQFGVHALYEENLDNLDVVNVVSPREVLLAADIIVELGCDLVSNRIIELNNQRLHIKVAYEEVDLNEDVDTSIEAVR